MAKKEIINMENKEKERIEKLVDDKGFIKKWNDIMNSETVKINNVKLNILNPFKNEMVK